VVRKKVINGGKLAGPINAHEGKRKRICGTGGVDGNASKELVRTGDWGASNMGGQGAEKVGEMKMP